MTLLDRRRDRSADTEEARLLGIYARYRERVCQEDNLINHRMGWMLASQAILFAFAGAISSSSFPVVTELKAHNLVAWALRLIGVVGVLFAIGSKYSISAAQGEIDYLREAYHAMHPAAKAAEEQRRIPSLVGHKNFHWVGHLVPRAMPVFLCLVWLMVLLATFHAAAPVVPGCPGTP